MTQPPPYPGDLGPEPQPPEEFSPANGLLRSVRGLGLAATAIAIVYGAFEVLEAALSWSAQNRILDASDAGESLDFLTPYDVVAVLWLPLLAVSYVITCLWLFQSRKNVEILRPHAPQARKKGWVWGGWLVPFVSLWFPFQIVRDILIDPARPSRGEKLVGWWWTSFLLGNIVERIGLRAISGSSDINAYSGLGPVETINAMLVLVALVLWLRIIRTISQDQDQDQAMGASPTP